MRLPCLPLVVVLLLPASAVAQERWVRAYNDGVRAFEQGNMAVAEAKLKEARELNPRQGRRVTFSSIDIRPYIPDYYLGLIAARNGRHSEAIALLEKAIAAGLVTEGQRNEYAAATGAMAKARDSLGRGPETPSWQGDFQRAMYAAEQALKAKRFADARTSANTARTSAKDARTQSDLAALERRIRSEEGTDIAADAREAISRGNDTEAQRQITRLTELNPQFPGLDQLRNDLADSRRRKEADQGRREADQIALRARAALDNRNASVAASEIARLAAANPQHSSLGQLRIDLSTLESSLKPAVNQQFLKFMADARSHFKAGRYADARVNVDSARTAAGDLSSRQQADQLRREIDAGVRQLLEQDASRIVRLAQSAISARNTGAAQNQIATLARLAPQHPLLEQLRKELARVEGQAKTVEDIARIEREGVRLFFSGEYEGVKAALQPSVTAGRASPRVYLYLACSNAALSLLAGPTPDAALLQQAREQYAQARAQRNEFTADRQYISPRILGLLEATP